MNAIHESALLFGCANEEMLGVLARPAAAPQRRHGVLIVVGGPQYRGGSHRQFVLLARQLARHGYAVLRFDYRGMGDSAGTPRTFMEVEDDLRAAAAALVEAVPELQGFVVWGLCDAASAALMFAPALPRCAGMILVNPWVRSEATLAKTHLKHYYGSRLLQWDFWRKFASGRFDALASVRALFASLKLALTGGGRAGAATQTSYVQRMLSGISRFPGKVLCILSGNDLTGKEFEDLTRADAHWRRAMDKPELTQRRIDGADHTFSSAAWRGKVEQVCIEWLDRL